jgi:hypothetical protein
VSLFIYVGNSKAIGLLGRAADTPGLAAREESLFFRSIRLGISICACQ